ncbi:MAG: TAT-variant-translocated molybdopterin oxidoreductase [Flavobacteriales bacterium]|nr:TAT-variant-translocated molybdopterin oxidoreductase [Flavobacteriales bacterium]MBP9079045.1 TAT-variant-translocated molybdopterin oxidoreductase [Flavobacteriales bacterium]
MSSTKRYWQDLSELDPAAAPAQANAHEFNEPMPLDQVLADGSITGSTTSRRDFLKFLGFSVGAATLAACEAPVIKSIPYVNKPEEITPGVANWYASTYYDGEDFASVLVKTREGRPIHITGNPRFGVNRDPRSGRSAVNARINSSVLSLYDSERLSGPMQVTNGQLAQQAWADADKAIIGGLAQASAAGKRIVLLTGTVISPSTKAAIEVFKAKHGLSITGGDAAVIATVGGVDHVQYDAISYAGISSANLKNFGKWAFPSYDLAKADVVVGIGADFLSNWGSTTENAWQYASRRKPEQATAAQPMSRHWQFEARMSMTGANADQRVAVKPSEVPHVVLALHNAIASALGTSAAPPAKLPAGAAASVAQCAKELVAARGKSVVMCGANDEGVQVLVNSINSMLGNYGSTIDLRNASPFFQGNDAVMAQLVKDLDAGTIGAILIHGVNPAYTLPNAEAFKAGLKKAPLSVSFGSHADETASLCSWIAPDHHWLESWGDHSPKVGSFALTQPTIRPLFDTRQWGESLLKWSGVDSDWRSFVQTNCRTTLTTSWDQGLHDGVYQGAAAITEPTPFTADLADAGRRALEGVKGAGEWELEVYASEALASGLHANNPWLQELPDPITKATWDNYICISPEDLSALTGKSFKELYIGQESPAQVLKVTVNGVAMELPAVLSPGQASKTIAVALGYGRGANGERVGRAACLRNPDGSPAPVGRNAYPWTAVRGNTVRLEALAAAVEPTGRTYAIALTQTQMTGMERGSIVKETTFNVWALNKPEETYNKPHTLAVHEDVNNDGHINAKDRVPATSVTLWADHPIEEMGHRWGMSIDLNSCIGCGACITACNSENNISVVGKDEVRRSREMHWLRIDRYYSSDTNKETGGLGWADKLSAMEEPGTNPSVLFIPMMCQHCNHAPCETVCPVAATTHSDEGLNMMAYNRCIGTRYCANNCPYKVRRFNWFNYVTEDFGQVNPAWDELGRMVLNPDVVVRARGVMEKCTLCVQRIQAGKLDAKKEGRPVRDGDIQTACSAACGYGAIIFGDLNDTNSAARAGRDNPRGYEMLEEIGTQPNITYLVKVRNTTDADNNKA